MRAMQVREFGEPEVLETVEAPEPVAGSGQIVVEVAVAEILFLDTLLRKGMGGDYFPLEPPYIPGVGVAGEVVSVGDGVDPAWIGKRIIAGTSGSGEYGGGGYAERAVTPITEVFEVPDGLDFRRAIAALSDGFMATSRMDRADIQPGERVLVNAAGGGIGIWLVPLAKAAGAQVIAVARGERKLDQARALGADIVVDYSEDGWIGKVFEATGGVDVIFDGAGGKIGGASFDVVASGGRFFNYGSAGGEFAEFDPQEAERQRVAVIGGVDEEITPEYQREMTGRALSMIAGGRVSPVIGQAVPLEKAAEAHAAIEARRVTGKSLLIVHAESPFTDSELAYMKSQSLGRLATVQPNGTLQNSPVGFRYNPDTATIDIRGYAMAKSRKYKNIVDNGRVAFVVDDVLSTSPWRVRCLEIRGRAEGIETSGEPFIRVHPERIISFGIDEPDKDPHELEGNFRNADEPPDRGARDRNKKGAGRHDVR